MIHARIWNKHHSEIIEHRNVRLLAAGVLLTLAEGATGPKEALIPWHRVHEVYSTTLAEIELEVSLGSPRDC